MAARIRKELGVEVEKIAGGYGEYKVLVDGRIIVDGGRMVMLGVMPPAKKTVEAVRAELASPRQEP